MMYDFFCIDIVGSSKDTKIQNDNIKNLLIVIKDFLSSYEKQIQTVFTGDGVIIWFKEDSLLPLQLALKIHKEFPQIKGGESCLGLKIGIARGDAIVIETAKSLVGYLFGVMDLQLLEDYVSFVMKVIFYWISVLMKTLALNTKKN